MLKGLVVNSLNKDFHSILLFFATICLLLLFSCEPEKLDITDGYLNINGSQIYYKSVGKGDPIIIVHGGPVLDHSYLLPHLEPLAKDFRLIFYDQRAAGNSSIDVDTSKMNLEAFIDDIEQIRKRLGLKKINLLGHSWGGLLAMGYGVKYSQNLEHLVLSNTMAPNVMDWQTESAEVANMQTAQDRFERQEILDDLKDGKKDRIALINELLMTSYKSQMFDRGNLDKLELSLTNDYELRSQIYQQLAPDMRRFNFDSDLKLIKCPTLILYGDMEPAVNLYADKLLDLINGAELVIIGQSGHFPFIEQQASFDNAVLNFLSN